MNSGLPDIFITKYDSSGNVLWAKSTKGSDTDKGSSASVDLQDHVYVTGYFSSDTLILGTDTLFNIGGAGSADIFIAGYDGNGNVSWAKNTGGISPGAGYIVATDAFGNVFVCGFFTSPSINFGSVTLANSGSSMAIFLVKYNSAGNVIWAKGSGSTGTGIPYNIVADATGNVFMAGKIINVPIVFDTISIQWPLNGSDPMFVIKFDSSGYSQWAYTLASGGDDQSAVAVDTLGNIYIGGDFLVNPFIVGADTLILNGIEAPFVAKLGMQTQVAISETGKNGSCILFPNPFDDRLTIVTKESGQAEMILYDMISRKVLEVFFTGATSVNTSRLAKGLYMYEVVNKKEIVKKGVIIKE
jgi:hypothetical protein